MKNLDKSSKDEETSRLLRCEMITYMQAASMCLINWYMPISLLREFYSGPLKDIADPIVFAAPLYQSLCDRYGINIDETLLDQVFSDIKILISEDWDVQMKVHPSTADCLISLGATRDIILTLGEISSIDPLPIKFIADDNVSIDYIELERCMETWRLKAFIDPELIPPKLIPLSYSSWSNGIDSIFRVIAYCEGAARRFKETENIAELDTIWKIISQDIFDCLRFGLDQRVQWEDAYGLPESIAPQIYQSITTLITEVYPNKVCDLLSFIDEQFILQCGVYSEGFRRILNLVLTNIVSTRIDVKVEDQAFALVERWKEYVVSNLENRYELVPELLSIVPLYTKLDASDEANKTYQLVLSFSMGPSWYKEDQIGLNITALKSIDDTYSVKTEVLSQIAGLLDAASGEMTFQRFVRYSKRDFIEVLSKRGSFSSAVDYFIRQTFGTLEQMYQEVTRGDIDRVSALKGTRFPGSALDEQDSIISLITPLIPKADWQLCWAVLESFHFGDSRHLDRFANAYSLLIEKVADDSNSLNLVVGRLEAICESEFSNEKERSEFFKSLISNLSKDLSKIILARFPDYIIEQSHDSPSAHLYKDLKTEDEVEGEDKDIDSFQLPGTFGSRSSIEEAEMALSKASKHLRRKNNSEAKKEILSAMNAIQSGDWPLWTGLSPLFGQVKSLLLQTESSVSDLIKLLSPLIVEKLYAESWQVAETLMTFLANQCPHAEQLQVLELVNEHTSLMIRNPDLTNSYELSDNVEDLSSCLVKLFLHVMEHPTWLRREKASELLIWLSRCHPDFVQLFGKKAFTMDCGVHPDLICGALEQLITTQNAWEALAQDLDFKLLSENCKHIGRYTVLLRIVKQAADRGSESAEIALGLLKPCFKEKTELAGLESTKLPSWAECIQPNWLKLEKINLTNEYVVNRAESILREVCFPLSIESSFELEQLLAEGQRGNIMIPNRWSDKVFYAFQVALYDIADESAYKHIEAIFRKYNPTRLDNLRLINFGSQAINWINSKKPNPVYGDSIYLDYCERVWFEDQLRLVRFTAYITDSQESIPLPSGRFLSTDKPSLESTNLIDTCANVDPLPTYFGSFTPAIPTTYFMMLTGARSSDLKRGWWKSGRLKEKYEGAPHHEGCFLSIDSNALRLPDGVSLIWVFELDLKPVGLISFG